MPEAALSVIAGPVIGSVVNDVLGSLGGGGGAAGGGGLFGGLLNNLTSAFSNLFGSNNSGYSQPPSSFSPFSPSSFSPISFSNPMSVLGPIFGTPGSRNDAAESAQLNSMQSQADSAEQAMMSDPTNVAKQLDYEKKQQALQNMVQMLQTQAKEHAEMMKQGIQNSILN
jgi:hypothetical protein